MEIKGVASGISLATYGIIPEALVRLVLVLIAVGLESGNDLSMLKTGIPVALIKSDREWYCTWEGIGSPREDYRPQAARLGVAYWRYSDYLYLYCILALNSDDVAENVYKRIGDVIQANVRKVTENGTLQLSKAVVDFQLKVTGTVKPLMLTLPIAANYDGNPKDNTAWTEFSKTITRGY